MTLATNISGLAAFDRLRLEFAYDYQGRRFSKTVYNWSVAETNFVPVSTNLFIYDGWNLLAELDGGAPLDPLPLIRSYTWGLDLADSFEDAGGIGGLLIVRDHLTATNTYHFPAYDGNGNVTGLVQSSGTPTAIYEYSPFGELIRSTGSASRLNPFQFSTKYLDHETGLSYYGHRYYNASLGRWISRDPIEEQGGVNIYGYVGNAGLDRIDPFGLFDYDDWELDMRLGIAAEGSGFVATYAYTEDMMDWHNQIMDEGMVTLKEAGKEIAWSVAMNLGGGLAGNLIGKGLTRIAQPTLERWLRMWQMGSWAELVLPQARSCSPQKDVLKSRKSRREILFTHTRLKVPVWRSALYSIPHGESQIFGSTSRQTARPFLQPHSTSSGSKMRINGSRPFSSNLG